MYIFVILVISHFGFEGRTFFLIASVPRHCLPFTFRNLFAKPRSQRFIIVCTLTKLLTNVGGERLFIFRGEMYNRKIMREMTSV